MEIKKVRHTVIVFVRHLDQEEVTDKYELSFRKKLIVILKYGLWLLTSHLSLFHLTTRSRKSRLVVTCRWFLPRTKSIESLAFPRFAFINNLLSTRHNLSITFYDHQAGYYLSRPDRHPLCLPHVRARARVLILLLFPDFNISSWFYAYRHHGCSQILQMDERALSCHLAAYCRKQHS